MKKLIFTFTVLASLFFAPFEVFSQCEPLSPEECPDPENNGQVCPDSLDAAFVDQFYSQVATIKPPAIYYLPPDSTVINLHHVKLIEVGNLPNGISWQSNTPDSVFVAGEYYCVLLEGTPDIAGEYFLRIVVDVYVLVFNVPVKVATAVDSTSLKMVVIDNSGLNEHPGGNLTASQNMPNPFRDETKISFYSGKEEDIMFDVYSMVGEKVYSEKLAARKGDNQVVFDGRKLTAGIYYYRLITEGNHAGGMMVKAD